MNPEETISIQEGSKITFTFTPDPGFCIRTVMLDGENVTAQVKDNSYTLEPQNLSADHDPHKLSVSFRGLKETEMNELFKALPSLDGTADYSEETIDAYLDAWIQYQALQKNSGMRLGSEVLQTYYKNLSCLPCFDLKVNVDERVKDLVSVPDVSPLLSSLTQEEAQGLLDRDITKISFLLKITPDSLSETQEQAVLSLLDSPVLMESFQASLAKIVERPGASNTWTSFPSGPSLTLRCSFAGAKPHEKGYERTFYIAMQKKASGETDDAALAKTKTAKKRVLTTEASSFPAVLPCCIRTGKPAEKPVRRKRLPNPNLRPPPSPKMSREMMFPEIIPPAAVPLAAAPPETRIPEMMIPGMIIPGIIIPTHMSRIMKRNSGRMYAPSFKRQRPGKR